MITRLEIRNFKSLRDVTLDLGPMNLIVGANASGKSNFFDALRVLQGIGNGFTVSEILDGRPKSATSEVWEGIRGGSGKACFEGPEKEEWFTITVAGSLTPEFAGFGLDDWRYSVTLAPTLGWVASESLEYRRKPLYRTDPGKRSRGPIHTVTFSTGNPGRPPNRKLERSRPVLPQFASSTVRVFSGLPMQPRSPPNSRTCSGWTRRRPFSGAIPRRTGSSGWVSAARTSRHS